MVTKILLNNLRTILFCSHLLHVYIWGVFFPPYLYFLHSPSEDHTYLCPVREKPLAGTVVFLAGLLGGQFGGWTEGLRKLQEAAIGHTLLAKNFTFLDAPSTGPGTLGEEEKVDPTQERGVFECQFLSSPWLSKNRVKKEKKKKKQKKNQEQPKGFCLLSLKCILEQDLHPLLLISST